MQIAELKYLKIFHLHRVTVVPWVNAEPIPIYAINRGGNSSKQDHSVILVNVK
jgi:hypothetical protein